MTVVRLAWLISGLLTLLALLSSAITWVPAPWHPETVVPGGLALGASMTALFAIGLGRLPPTHWVHSTGPVWVCLAGAAIVVALLALIG
jgi:hypothetical protein